MILHRQTPRMVHTLYNPYNKKETKAVPRRDAEGSFFLTVGRKWVRITSVTNEEPRVGMPGKGREKRGIYGKKRVHNHAGHIGDRL